MLSASGDVTAKSLCSAVRTIYKQTPATPMSIVVDLRSTASLRLDHQSMMMLAFRTVAAPLALGPVAFVIPDDYVGADAVAECFRFKANAGLTRRLFRARRMPEALAWATEEAAITKAAILEGRAPMNWKFPNNSAPPQEFVIGVTESEC